MEGNLATASAPRLQNVLVDYALDIVDLSKRFRRYTQKGRGSYTTIKTSLLGTLLGRGRRSERVYTEAVKDLTLRVPKGSSVGIIGRNGSGKSTLLKLITGIYKADAGKISVNGRVAALIELGAGFHPDFTGRENLFLAGAMYGLTREELEERFDEIVTFAELTDVIDDPVRTYSSGMFMRLGFSLAVHVDPEILLVDEVLAVGDEGFNQKCKEKISKLKREGKSLVLVTHDLAAVERWCDEVLWLHKGEVRERGEPRRVIDCYRQFIEKGEEYELILKKEREQAEAKAKAEESQEAKRWGSREVELASFKILDGAWHEHRVFRTGDKACIQFDYKVNQPVDEIVFGIGINRADGMVVFGSNTHIEKVTLPVVKNSGTVRFEIEQLNLLEGSYSIDVAVHKEDGYPYDYHKDCIEFKVRSPFKRVGVWAPVHRWSVR